MQKNTNIQLAPKYQEMLHGVNISPEQDKTLRDMYRGTLIPTKPHGLAILGILSADAVFLLYSFSQYAQTNNKEIMTWYIAAVLAQLAAAVAYGCKLLNKETQLKNTINEIKKQNVR